MLAINPSHTFSFLYYIRNISDLYAKLEELKEHFDFSNYPSGRATEDTTPDDSDDTDSDDTASEDTSADDTPSTAHPLFSEVNKTVIGKFKDETASVPIKEFVGLR